MVVVVVGIVIKKFERPAGSTGAETTENHLRNIIYYYFYRRRRRRRFLNSNCALRSHRRESVLDFAAAGRKLLPPGQTI